jgi:protein-L-isoaspartate O-methyltransferase
MKKLNQNSNEKLSLEQATEWRYPIWAPAVSFALRKGSESISPRSRVLELGYNSGLMAIYLAKTFDYFVEGYEIEEEKKINATKLAAQYGVKDKINFYALAPEKTKDIIKAPFDAIFIKSFLYHNKNLKDYLSWLEWFKLILKPNGLLIAVENGEGNFIDKFYRRKIMKNCSWKNNYFFNQNVENYLKNNFSSLNIEYFGGISQYLTFIPFLSKQIQKLENPKANNCFIASLVAKK